MADKYSKLLSALVRNATFPKYANSVLYGPVKNQLLEIKEFPRILVVWRKGCKNVGPNFYSESRCGVGILWLKNNLTEEEWAEFTILRLSGRIKW